jgi:hypothetical protein
MSIADRFSDRRAWRQGFWGDLAFRIRLFMAPARVVEVLNASRTRRPASRPRYPPTDRARCSGSRRALAILNQADEALSEARLTLREFVFGRVEPLADIKFDGPEQCALMIDRDESDFYVDRSGVVRDSTGREVPKNVILTHGRRL